MQLRQIKDKQVWEKSLPPDVFLLQTWDYGEFARLQGREIFRLGFYQAARLVGVAQVAKILSKRGNYLACHGGPIANWHKKGWGLRVLERLHDFAKQARVDFLRIQLPLPYNHQLVRRLNSAGFGLAPMYFPAEHTLFLDLRQSEEDLLANMRKNTRYAIRRAAREGVQISLSSNARHPTGVERALQSFFRLYRQTVERQQFVGYDYKYFQNQIRAFLSDDQVAIVLAQYQGEVVAGAIIFFCANTAYYLHGASIPIGQKVYASYAVQWAGIREAQRRGLKRYDFWGVAPPLNASHFGSLAPRWNEKHPRAGITLFKRGFGGKYFRWMPTMDLPLTWRYWLTYAYVKYERWRRGL